MVVFLSCYKFKCGFVEVLRIGMSLLDNWIEDISSNVFVINLL